MPVKVNAIHETRVDAVVTDVMARDLSCFNLAYVIIFFSWKKCSDTLKCSRPVVL
jgi:hypothetical protein